MAFFMEQFAHPRGVLGSIAGWLLLVRNKERNRWTLNLLQMRPTDQVLEIGFGPGWAVAEAAKLVSRGGVTGIDPSETMLKDASARNAAAIRAGQVRLRLGSESPLPFAESAFDKVLAVNSFQFWSNAQSGLSEVRRVLRSGGRVAITVQPMWVKSDEEARQVGADLKRQLSEAGFQSVRLEMLPLQPLCFCAVGVK